MYLTYLNTCRCSKDNLNQRINSPHCPLRKGIIYYSQHGMIFEHNIHSSGENEVDSHAAHWESRVQLTNAFKPRINFLKHPLGTFGEISVVPIKGSRILLLAHYKEVAYAPYLHLSIHEIRSNNRVGPALWSSTCPGGPAPWFIRSFARGLNASKLELKKSTESALGITLEAQFDDHWKLFNISPSSTTEADALNDFPLIESGRIDYVPKPKENPWMGEDRLGLSEILMQSCRTCSHVFSQPYCPLTGASSYMWIPRKTDTMKRLTFTIRIPVAQTI